MKISIKPYSINMNSFEEIHTSSSLPSSSTGMASAGLSSSMSLMAPVVMSPDNYILSLCKRKDDQLLFEKRRDNFVNQQLPIFPKVLRLYNVAVSESHHVPV